jgi:hypothetical protein
VAAADSLYDEFRTSLRRLALDKVEPHAAAYDREARFPPQPNRTRARRGKREDQGRPGVMPRLPTFRLTHCCTYGLPPIPRKFG